MRLHKKYLLKIIIFFVLISSIYAGINVILTPKYLQDNNWPTTQTYQDFYQMDKDSIDVLFLGSSHAVNAFSPIELYKEYGITSYNLSCEQQNMLLSYFWLKEALRYQTPKIVVLDTCFLFSCNPQEPLNTPEAITRKAIDYMRWSSVKREAVYDICLIDEKQDLLSYYFTNIRFHTRWTELNEDDFSFMRNLTGLYGFSALNGTISEIEREKMQIFSANENMNEEMPLEIMLMYLDKIEKLCKEEGIQLILCKTPAISSSVQQYNYVQNYAKEKQVLYYDFNEEALFNEVGFQKNMDFNDGMHLNYKGAKKITDYMGTIFEKNYKFVNSNDAQYSSLVDYYDGIIKDCKLHEIDDFVTYMDYIEDSRYIVFLSVQDAGTSTLTTEYAEELKKLNIRTAYHDLQGRNYILILDNLLPYEEVSQNRIEKVGTIRNGKIPYKVISDGVRFGNISSIMIDGTEYSKQGRGLNFVVYSLSSRKVIDSVCFDVENEFTAIR